MKKLLFLFMLPALVFCQTYDEIMKITSQDLFVRYMAENGYERDEPNNDEEEHVYSLFSYKGSLTEKVAQGIFRKDGNYRLAFKLSYLNQEKTFNDIYSAIKEWCIYHQVRNNQVDYACCESGIDECLVTDLSIKIEENIGYVYGYTPALYD